MSDNDKAKSKLMESIRMTKAGKNKKEDAPAADAKPAEPAKAAETKAAPKPKAKPKASKPAPAKKAETKVSYLPSQRVWPD